jgi:hypothetical protein
MRVKSQVQSNDPEKRPWKVGTLITKKQHWLERGKIYPNILLLFFLANHPETKSKTRKAFITGKSTLQAKPNWTGSIANSLQSHTCVHGAAGPCNGLELASAQLLNG